MQAIVVANDEEVIASLVKEIKKRADAAIAERDVFCVGLSGGSLPKQLGIAIPLIETDLKKWKFFFCDERFVAADHHESNFGAFQKLLLPACPDLVEDQFVCINENLTLEQCAIDYEQKIRDEFGTSTGVPVFDLLLLGMGPDGHTCSLFPNHPLLEESQRLVAHIADSPKPPSERVTMTFPLVNAAHCCMLVICGASKADMVKNIFIEKQQLPAGLVAPTNGELIGIFDDAAGHVLKQ